MQRKNPERLLFDRAIDELKPFLPADYGRLVRAKNIDISLERLWRAVRKRGVAPDWPAYNALLEVKQDKPVERKPRKKHKPRSPRQLLQAA